MKRPNASVWRSTGSWSKIPTFTSLSSTSRARDLIKAQLRPFRDSALTFSWVVRETLKLERQRPLLNKQRMFRWWMLVQTHRELLTTRTNVQAVNSITQSKKENFNPNSSSMNWSPTKLRMELHFFERSYVDCMFVLQNFAEWDGPRVSCISEVLRQA